MMDLPTDPALSTYLLSFFGFAFFGSIHCAGMCGPISLLIPPSKSATGIPFSTWYHTGRIFTYAFLGGFAGISGRILLDHTSAGSLSIFCGGILGFFCLFSGSFFHSSKEGGRVQSVFRRIFRVLTASGTGAGVLLLGIFNGLLPCGFLYSALLLAASSGDFLLAYASMLGFGLGSTPAFFLLHRLRNSKFSYLLPRGGLLRAVSLILAMLLILRGIYQIQNAGSFPTETRCHYPS